MILCLYVVENLNTHQANYYSVGNNNSGSKYMFI